MTGATWWLGIDIGGTFTDLVALNRANGEHVHLKVSTTPSDPSEGFLEALETFYRKMGADRDSLSFIFHGTTLATNAIIERRLSPTALVTTRGFRDVLEIGRHWRPHLYDLELERPAPLVPRRLRMEVEERLDATGSVVTALDEGSVERVLAEIEAADVEAVAVVFLHSYANPEHEESFVGRLRKRFGDALYVCSSSELSREPREYERTATTVLNAALMRMIDDYLETLGARLGEGGNAPTLFITQSNGGALTVALAKERPVNLAQSGPVAGVTACLGIGAALDRPNLIAFDMGGTSTDVALIEDGEARLTMELKVGDLPVRTPSVRIHSIGAGGGSIAWLDGVGALRVGPKSAGANPGPACYGRGGDTPTVTDCHLVLGRLSHERPLAEFLELDLAAAQEAVRSRIAEPLGLTVEEAAQGVIDVVNAAMEGAIRVVLRERGNDPRDFALVAFGGAGPLHAVELAARLGVGSVICPLHPGTLSAQGLLTSDLRQDFAITRIIRSDAADAPTLLAAAADDLASLAQEHLADDSGFPRESVERQITCDVRYLGQAYEVPVPLAGPPDDPATFRRLIEDFHALHQRAYAFSNPNEPCELVTHRLFVTSKLQRSESAPFASPSAESAAVHGERAVVYDGEELRCVELFREDLLPGSAVPTPCVIVQADSTTFVPGGVTASVAETGDLLLTDIKPL